jgi:hypothetical protein
MKNLILFSFLLLTLYIGWTADLSQNSDHLYKVVLVKGKPLREGNALLRDGQRLEDREKVTFTSLQDVVILMNSHFEKIYLKPKANGDLKKPLLVKSFMTKNGVYSELTKNLTVNTRAVEKSFAFQSAFDTLSLELVSDLKQPETVDSKGYKLFDHFMEIIPNAIALNEGKLIIKPSKKGIFYLHYSNGKTNGSPLAEIEFLEKDEVLAELSFISKSATPPDSSKSFQLKHLRKLYPALPKIQVESLIQ